MSFLRAQGHVNAARYPLCTLWTEARLARNRINLQLSTQAILLQAAIGSVLSKEGGKAFKELIEGLTDGSKG